MAKKLRKVLGFVISMVLAACGLNPKPKKAVTGRRKKINIKTKKWNKSIEPRIHELDLARVKLLDSFAKKKEIEKLENGIKNLNRLSIVCSKLKHYSTIGIAKIKLDENLVIKKNELSNNKNKLNSLKRELSFSKKRLKRANDALKTKQEKGYEKAVSGLQKLIEKINNRIPKIRTEISNLKSIIPNKEVDVSKSEEVRNTLDIFGSGSDNLKINQVPSQLKKEIKNKEIQIVKLKKLL